MKNYSSKKSTSEPCLTLTKISMSWRPLKTGILSPNYRMSRLGATWWIDLCLSRCSLSRLQSSQILIMLMLNRKKTLLLIRTRKRIRNLRQTQFPASFRSRGQRGQTFRPTSSPIWRNSRKRNWGSKKRRRQVSTKPRLGRKELSPKWAFHH